MKIETLPLYFLFLSFMLSAILSTSREDNLLYYIFTIIGIITILLSVLFVKPITYFKFSFFDAILLISISYIINLGMILYYELMGIVLLLLSLSIILYFKMVRLSVVKLLKVINITYLIYLLLSILNYSELVLVQEPEAINSFLVDYGFISFQTLYGLEGSTASIDSYSALIVLLNVFFNNGLNRYLITGIALFALLWTTRFTPIVILFFSIASYIIVKNRFIAVLAISSIFLGFYFFSFIEMNYPDGRFFNKNISNKMVLHLLTHGRSFIWSEQLQSITNNFKVLDFIIGNYQYAEISIPWGKGTTANSHNSFFHLFFRTGVTVVIMIIFFTVEIFKKFDRRTFPIIFGIFLSATTNGTIFYVGNPVFLLVLIYLLFFYKKYNFIK